MTKVSASQWFKSSYSGGSGTECVECAHASDSTSIRDSKWAHGPIVHVRHEPWRVFIQALTRTPEPGSDP
ncbi:DUF397 domain-containing protein [Streptomyces fumanus]|uniref:DUF397 domain-containing protein n=1 Tax=Streptomyces fumanus TaxID=67302 RepID=UPI00340CA927